MSDGRPVSGQLKKFVFRGKSTTNGDTRGEYLEIKIPELLSAGYSFYTWPSAPLLAWYLWTQRRHLRGLRVLELGCGTGLPGILAAKCGARVTLTDSVALPRSLRHLSACCEANNLVPGHDIQILGLAWGLFLTDVHSLRPVDLVLASDCFYDPSQFEEVISTVGYLLDGTDTRFLCAYQERSADWSIEALLKKWGLKGALIDLDSLSESSGVDYRALIGERSLHLLEIVCAQGMASTARAARLYVGNLPWTVGHRQLREYFAQFGAVQSSRVVFDRSTGLSKGYGFIEFASPSAAADAINKQVHTLEGLNLTVQTQNNQAQYLTDQQFSMAAAQPEYPDSDFSDEDQSPLDVSFNQAAGHVRKLTSKLDNNQLLELYGLYKQGTEGKCNTPKPGWLDGRGRRKWEAWKSLGDMPIVEAKEKYIILVQKFDPEWSDERATGLKEQWVAVSSLRRSSESELDEDELSLLGAAREDREDRVAELLRQNPEMRHEKDDDGLTALHWAADRNATKALTAAIEGGCVIDAVDEYGQTALHYASSCGHIHSTKILLNAGASLLKDVDDCTPLDLATDDEIKKLLEGAKM